MHEESYCVVEDKIFSHRWHRTSSDRVGLGTPRGVLANKCLTFQRHSKRDVLSHCPSTFYLTVHQIDFSEWLWIVHCSLESNINVVYITSRQSVHTLWWECQTFSMSENRFFFKKFIWRFNDSNNKRCPALAERRTICVGSRPEFIIFCQVGRWF